jgi:hypothetical protein
MPPVELGGIVEVVMELSVGQSDSFYSVCSRGKHDDVE